MTVPKISCAFCNKKILVNKMKSHLDDNHSMIKSGVKTPPHTTPSLKGVVV